MMRIQSLIMITTAISIVFVSQMNAYCAKCVKIEEDRAKEQAAHPQPWRYYDDPSKLPIKEETTKKENTTPPSVNTINKFFFL